MATLQSSIDMKNRSATGPHKMAPERGLENPSKTTGSGGIKASLSKKNAGTTPSRGVEKTNAYF